MKIFINLLISILFKINVTMTYLNNKDFDTFSGSPSQRVRRSLNGQPCQERGKHLVSQKKNWGVRKKGGLASLWLHKMYFKSIEIIV